MGNFDAARVIEAAATSNLGVISLLLLVLAFLAWRFFQRSDDKIKLIAFAMMFVGAAGFVAAVMLAGGGEEGARAASDRADSDETDSLSAEASMFGESGTEPRGVPNIQGAWQDSDGYRYVFRQDAYGYSYDVFFEGERVGNGVGSIAGRRMEYQFIDSANGTQGRCGARVAPDAQSISGTCDDGSTEWSFTIRR